MLRVFLESIAVAAAFLICLSARPIGVWLGVMDHPNLHHKNHTHATPSVGGIGILVPLMLWLTGCLASGLLPDTNLLVALLLCASGVGVMGFADDQTPTSPSARILLLLVFLAVAFAVAPSLIADRFNWGSFEPTLLAPWAYCGLMAVAVVGIVNAVNMADGQNGLVTGMFVIWTACLWFVGDETVSAVAGLLFATGLVVFAFNLKGKLFLGNCGSHGVTFVIGLLIMLTHAEGRISVETVTVWLFIPVMDCLRLIAVRVSRGHSPARGDTDHFHHRLQNKLGQNYGLFAYLKTVAATSFVATLSPQFALVAIIVLTAVYFSFASLTVSASDRKAESEDLEQPDERQVAAAGAKIVPMKQGERTANRDGA